MFNFFPFFHKVHLLCYTFLDTVYSRTKKGSETILLGLPWPDIPLVHPGNSCQFSWVLNSTPLTSWYVSYIRLLFVFSLSVSDLILFRPQKPLSGPFTTESGFWTNPVTLTCSKVSSSFIKVYKKWVVWYRVVWKINVLGSLWSSCDCSLGMKDLSDSACVLKHYLRINILDKPSIKQTIFSS